MPGLEDVGVQLVGTPRAGADEGDVLADQGCAERGGEVGEVRQPARVGQVRPGEAEPDAVRHDRDPARDEREQRRREALQERRSRRRPR